MGGGGEWDTKPKRSPSNSQFKHYLEEYKK